MSKSNKRIPHIMVAPKTSRQPANLLFFDTETKGEINQDDLSDSRHTLWFGCALAFRYENDKRTRIKTSTFHVVDEFWDFVKSRTDNIRPLYMFAHNLAFDLTILDFWQRGEELGFECKYAVLEGPPTMIHLSWEGRSIIIIDTLNYWRESLASLGESVGKDKLPMPPYDGPWESWIKYCLNDVEILAIAVTNLMRFLKTNDLGSYGITVASIAFNVFKHRFMKTEIFIHDNEKALALERQSYHGGLVHCFFIGEIKNKTVYHYDVNSLYPFCMLNPVPVKLTQTLVKPRVSLVTHKMSRSGCVANCEIVTRGNTYPVQVDGKLIEATGHFQAVLCGAELKQALDNKEVVSVSEAAFYNMEVIFKDYVDYFWKMRNEFPKEVNPVVNRFAKLLMNSLYGKFGQLGYDWLDLDRKTLTLLYEKEGLTLPEYYNNPDSAPNLHWGQSQWQPIGYPHSLTIRKINDKLQVKTVRGEHYESSPIIASYITSYARHYLRTLIGIAGKRNVYYCDTDSLFVTPEGKRRLERQKLCDSRRLGMLKLEGESKRVTFYCPKDYRFNDKVVTKGISSSAICIGDGEYIQNQFEGLKGILRRGGESYVSVSYQVKKLTRNFDKATILKDGWTEFLHLEMEKAKG